MTKTECRFDSRPYHAIVVGGLIVGVLDLGYAILVYSPHHPEIIPKVIASGVLGQRSFTGGPATVILGVALHFVIALGAATTYYLASRKLKFMVNRALVCGLIYGALVYVFMHFIVVPLSARPHLSQMPFAYRAAEFVEHWFFVGLPIAFSVRHFSQ